MNYGLEPFFLFLANAFLDGLNPSVLGLWLFFTFFVLMREMDRARIFQITFFLLVAIFLCNTVLESLFYVFQLQWVAWRITDAVLYLSGIGAIMIGLMQLYDWWIYKKDSNPDKLLIKRLPFGKVSEGFSGKFPANAFWGIIFWGLVASFFMKPFFDRAVLSTMEETLSGQNSQLIFLGFHLIYHIVFIIPLILFFYLTSLNAKALTDKLEKDFGKLKIIFSAAFLGLGFGLLYTLTI